MGDQHRFSRNKIYIELLALVLYPTKPPISNARTRMRKVPCPFRTWTFTVLLVSVAVLGGTCWIGRGFRKVCALLFFYNHEKDFYTYFIKHDCLQYNSCGDYMDSV